MRMETEYVITQLNHTLEQKIQPFLLHFSTQALSNSASGHNYMYMPGKRLKGLQEHDAS